MAWLKFRGLAVLAATAWASAAACDPAPAPVDLAKAFGTRSPWRLTATPGPDTEDYGGNPAPGALQLCLRKGPAGPCIAAPVTPPPQGGAGSPDWEPHYLKTAVPVYPQGPTAAPLLEIVTASLHAGDGGQVIATQLLRYDRPRDAFERIYVRLTGTNNNEEVRFVAKGPLRGAVIAAEPTQNAPFAYWITVSRFTAPGTYRQVLRYRSATRYDDGNDLAVIDSEMPNLLQRLGLWTPGAPLPLPSGKACPAPRMKGLELWCDAKGWARDAATSSPGPAAGSRSGSRR